VKHILIAGQPLSSEHSTIGVLFAVYHATAFLITRDLCFPWGPFPGIIRRYRTEYGDVRRSTRDYNGERER
jgi:hypothetical protein